MLQLQNKSQEELAKLELVECGTSNPLLQVC